MYVRSDLHKPGSFLLVLSIPFPRTQQTFPMANTPFSHEYSFVTHGSTTISALYTNISASADAWVDKAEGFLAGSKLKFVGVDLEFSSKGYRQKASMLQLCVGIDCLVYHIFCVADEISVKFNSFLRSWEYKFVGFDTSSDTTMLRRSGLYIFNHIDIQSIWKDPDLIKLRRDGTPSKQGMKDVAGVLIHPSYYEMKGGMTDADHQLWHKAPLSEKHLKYAAKDGYVSYELYKILDFYERGCYKVMKRKEQEPLRKW